MNHCTPWQRSSPAQSRLAAQNEAVLANPAMRWAQSQCATLSRLVRLRPFDITTESGRANERHRRAALAVLSSAVARASTIGAAFISVPLTIRYLGTERYGMWMTLVPVTLANNSIARW